jgi:hypothetical protein
MNKTRRIVFIRGLATCLLVTAVGSCSRNNRDSQRESEKVPEQVSVISKEDAIEIAKKEAIKRNWTQIRVDDVTFTNRYWEISLRHIPNITGGYAIVHVSTTGKLIEYYPGE